MDSTSIVSSVAQSDGTTTLANESDRATISRGEFLKILVAELSYQDPMEPMSNADMAGQMAQIESLRASSELSEGFGTLLRRQDIASAGTMIGREISGLTASGESVEGLVERVTISSDAVSLIVDGFTVPIENVLEIEQYVAPVEEG